jgi:hypothetical protein
VNEGLWECDGCGFIGTYDEVDTHIVTVNTLPDGTLKDPSDVTCWGSMKIGSDVWNAYHFDGVHPMVTFVQSVARVYNELGIGLEDK